MFKWLAQKAGDAAMRSQEKELLTFIQSLKGMTQDEIAGLLVPATRQRLMLPEHGVSLTDFLDGGNPDGCAAYAIRIGSFIRDFQKSGDLAAAGAMMIWVHSVRAVLSPPLRIHGKAIWAELMRGFPDVGAAWMGFLGAGLPLENVEPADCRYVPALLDPTIR